MGVPFFYDGGDISGKVSDSFKEKGLFYNQERKHMVSFFQDTSFLQDILSCQGLRFCSHRRPFFKFNDLSIDFTLAVPL